MSDFVTAMTGAGLTVAVGLTAIARSVRPSGRHRAPRPAAETELLRPVEALDAFEAYCPAEDRPTLQLHLRLGGSVCTECHNPTTTTKGGVA
jgi:NAD-dependent SIR2 family protein deacetylase